jgi:branched-chain amino acid transport system substrate-binding protein
MKKTILVTGAALLFATGAVWAQTPQGVTDKEVLIGIHIDLSGPMSFWGVPQRNGHQMAYDEINAAGGVHGRRLRYVMEDNGLDPKKGVLATQKLIQQDKVFALVGVMGTPVVLASKPIAIEAGIPFMYPGSSSRLFWEPLNKYTFSIGSPFDEQTKASVRWFAGKKKRLAVIYQDDDYGKDIRDAAMTQAKASGMEVVAEASYKRGDTAFSSQVARVRQGNPDLVVLGTIIRETVGVAVEARRLGWNVDFLVATSACNQAVPDLGKEAAEGLYVMCQFVPFDFDNETPAVKDWMTRYEKRFGVKADMAAAMAYDTDMLTKLALERAGRDLTVDSFLRGAESIKNWQDIFGSPPHTFGPDQHVGTRSAILTQIQGGKFKRLGGPLQ